MTKICYLNPQKAEKLSFYQTQNGLLATEAFRKPIKREEVQYEKMRSHQTEFGNTVQTAVSFRAGLQDISEIVPNKVLFHRIVSQLFQVVKTDTVNYRGQRTVEDGDTRLLQGFEVNENSRFQRVFRVPFVTDINRVSGEAGVLIPSFIPINKITRPKDATHFKIVVHISAFNFRTGEEHSDMHITAPISLTKHVTNTQILTVSFPPNDPRHLFLSLGIIFEDKEQGRTYKVFGDHHNAMQIVAVHPRGKP
ncbi:hypothetical protein LX64_00914 [Chitinophaga skermanii]|uniref:Uncharacterized protein n=1 Tax=Chitinophaga skermanii TaxID=331697 RepID=A0A327R304_9BACT|nr:hypothetical protein [Chitinophaga skermanii]RAJ08267.1 hypothetical protein LX64_00914 [Chitinophaga skermanii]